MRNGERSPRREALERCAIALWLATIVVLLFATLGTRLAHAEEPPTDVGAGTLLFRSSAGFDPAAPLSTDVRLSIAGVVARVSIAQRFRNPGTEWAEAVYALPLPDDAAVDRLTMRIGDRLIEGEIREREEAQRVYRAARDSGRRASIVSQATPNLFTTAVANIGPGEWVDIEIEYLQTARYDSGELSVRLPLTLTPRYGIGDAPEQRNALPAVTVPDGFTAAAIAARNEATIEAALTPGIALVDVTAQGHEIAVTQEGGRYTIRTLAPRVPMDRDFVLAWRPALGSSPVLAAVAETRGDTTYALLMLLPPARLHAGYGAPAREQIFVIDTSGSMAGAALEQAKAALTNALGRLSGADRFNVIEFNSVTTALYREPQAFASASHAEALRFVGRLRADGGTEMLPAVQTALREPAAPGFLRQVIFLTDAGVANETELFTAIKQGLGDARLFTVGIGAAPNSHFMRKAAQFGRGTFTHISSTAAVAEAMDALLAKLDQVALSDVLVDWPDALEMYPHRLPDLYAGEPVVIAASFPAKDTPVEVHVSGRAGGVPWGQSVAVPAGDEAGIAALWARRKIEFLVDSRVDGVPEDIVRALVLDVALEHGLVSPYTSLVAVDKTPARSAAAAIERRAVANMAPAGHAYAALPQTATVAPLALALGALALAAAAALFLLRERRV